MGQRTVVISFVHGDGMSVVMVWKTLLDDNDELGVRVPVDKPPAMLWYTLRLKEDGYI